MTQYPQTDSARSVAIAYVQRQLAQGKSFSSLLLTSLDLSGGGTFIALTPDEYSQNQVVELDLGHIIGVGTPRRIRVGNVSGIAHPTPNADGQLTELVSQLLEGPDYYCVLENPLAASQDTWLARAKSRVITYESDVYHLLTYTERDEVSVGEAIREAHSLPTFTGAVGKAPGASESFLSKRKGVTLDELRAFASSVTFLFTLAYDGEGYLCWRR